jgi:signal transduction histidine kinase
MSPSVSIDCLDVFPEPLLVVSGSGRLGVINRPAAGLLHLPDSERPEVTLREITDLSATEFGSLLDCCLAATAPVPLQLSFYPAGGRALSLRCEGWCCTLGGEAAAMVRVFDHAEPSARFGRLNQVVNQLNQECLARRDSENRLRTALSQLHDINSIRDHMLAQVSHDLRTPLNAILGMTEFMQTQPFGPLGGKYCEYVGDIHTSGDILLQLVDQVLHLAWADAHSRESSTETLADLSECLENCYRVVEPIARLRGLHIVVPRSGGMPKLRADQLLLKQILMNLLGNAAKYTDRGGHIEVTLEWRKGNVLAIQVKDDGPGIPRDKLAAINSGQVARSPYVIGDSQTGFGLALSRRTAKAIGGRLDIRSVVGHGTVASLVLPSNLVEAGPLALH